MKPESSPDEALKDGLAFRIEVDGDGEKKNRNVQENMRDAVFRTIMYFRDNFSAQDIVIENSGGLQPKEMESLVAEFHKYAFRPSVIDAYKPRDDADPESPEANPIKSSKFSYVKFLGNMRVPKGGNPGALRHRRSFEVQLVDPKNEHNRGDVHEDVYRFKKKMVVATRMLSGFSQEWFMQHALPIERDGIISSQKLLERLIKQGFIVPLSSDDQSPQKFYAVAHVLERWTNVKGLITNELLRNLWGYAIKQGKKK